MLLSRYLLCKLREHGSLPLFLLLLTWLYRGVRIVLRSSKTYGVSGFDRFRVKKEVFQSFMNSGT